MITFLIAVLLLGAATLPVAQGLVTAAHHSLTGRDPPIRFVIAVWLLLIALLSALMVTYQYDFRALPVFA